jgi:hypothetical protein
MAPTTPIALDQLLIRKLDEGVSRNVPGTLHCACCREGPATTAYSLGSDIGHCTLESPIDGVRDDANASMWALLTKIDFPSFIF